jgi:hypothetical protein
LRLSVLLPPSNSVTFATANKKFAVIGLSVGHRYKTSNPNDKGAVCAFGDWEADHAEVLAKKVAELLQS